MSNPNIVICLDGCGPEYLAAADTPNLDEMAKSGWSVIGNAVMPTVTNVNNVSLVTGSYPERHGIIGNYFRNESGHEQYMESADFLLAPTIFERLAKPGRRSACLTAKDKLRTLLVRGTEISASAEKPPAWLIKMIGAPPNLYTVESDLWLLDAALAVLAARPGLELMYVSTTDFVMHSYGPDHSESQRHLYEMDKRIGKIVNQFNGVNIGVTADHGMSAKTIGLDPGKILSEAGISAQVIPIIKDRHVLHHQNLSGSAYVYLDDSGRAEEATLCLQEESGIEGVLFREEASVKYHLYPDRIGDLMLLADDRTVFGELPENRVEVQVRSHGSLHEQEVPIIAYGQGMTGKRAKYNKDLMNIVFPDPGPEESQLHDNE